MPSLTRIINQVPSKIRYFTLQEATAALPRIRGHMRRVFQLHSLLRTTAEQLSDLHVAVTPDLLAAHDAVELPQSAIPTLATARALYACIRDELEAIHSTGAQVKDVERGLVDFRSYRDGADVVLLCWHIGERDIAHYHEPDKGFQARKPLGAHVFLSEPLNVQRV
ncbi:MAG: DUF2203 domain-containing protein [Myxococcales bacterium]|nr:DUF2203 domain-containing protein [Myxococcales bacterium]